MIFYVDVLSLVKYALAPAGVWSNNLLITIFLISCEPKRAIPFS